MGNNLLRGLITLAIGIAIWYLPVPAGLKPQAWHLFAIFVATLVGFILHPMPMGAVALASITITAAAGVLTTGEVLSGFSNTSIWLIISAFPFARAVVKTGLGRRIAYKFIKAWGGSALKLGYSMVFSDLLMSVATPSNTARSGGILFPIARSLCDSFDSQPGPTARRFGAYMMQTVYHGSAITSAMFMTAMAGNPLCVELAKKTLGLEISWFDWAQAAILPGLISLLVVPYLLYILYPPSIRRTPEAKTIAAQELMEMGPMSRQEKIVARVFLGVLVLWMLPGIKALLPWLPVINATLVALIGVLVLLTTNVLEWRDIIEEGGAWDSLVWMGSIVALANYLSVFGFISWFANTAGLIIAGISWIKVFIGLLVVYMFSHYVFTSLTARITAMYAAFITVAVIAGVPTMLAVLSFAFLSSLCMSLTHYAAGPSPIFFNAGYVPQASWGKLGFIVSLVHMAIWIGLGSVWWKLLGLW